MKLVVTLGAGASYDCIDTNLVTNYSSQYRPPLVNDLFRLTFDEILNNHLHVKAIVDEFRRKLREQWTFEQLLKNLEQRSSLVMKKAAWEVPLYLKALFGFISTNFLQQANTKYINLINYIEESKYSEVLFLTTNYDLGVEYALSNLKKFHSVSSYIDGKYALVKLHGSVNWGQKVLDLQHIPTSTVSYIASLTNKPTVAEEINITPDYSQHTYGNHFYYPRISSPIEGKNDFACPIEHLQFAKSFINNCSDFLFIGFSGSDEHVLKLFANAINIRKIKIVNNDGMNTAQEKQAEPDTLFNRLVRTNRQFSMVNAIHPGGFVDFDNNSRLEKFIKSDNQI